MERVRSIAAAPATPGPVVLVVDDCADVRELVTEVLRVGGARVATAPSVAAALEVLGSLVVDVVVTDYAMPGATGLELLRAMQDDPRWRGIPAVLMSAHGDSLELRREAFVVGATFLAKPFACDDLQRAVEERCCAKQGDGSR